MIPPKIKKHKELKPEELRWKCDSDIFEFTSTSDIEPIEGILGQERALKALRLGVELKGPGYNIYMAGLSGLFSQKVKQNSLKAHFTQPSKC